jgi:hypothetical protein
MSEHEFNAQEETERVAARAAAELPPGQDPDSVARLAKTVAANTAVEGSAGLPTDPVTDEDREKYAEKRRQAVDKADSEVRQAAQKRRESGTREDDTPQNRQTAADRQHTTTSAKPAEEPKSGNEPKPGGGSQQPRSGGKS